MRVRERVREGVRERVWDRVRVWVRVHLGHLRLDYGQQRLVRALEGQDVLQRSVALAQLGQQQQRLRRAEGERGWD